MVIGIRKGGIIHLVIQSPEAEHSRELLKLWRNNGVKGEIMMNTLLNFMLYVFMLFCILFTGVVF